eukprot:COSAG01_NODE_6308_length_3737_cov_2.062534_4_plen_225_part_00
MQHAKETAFIESVTVDPSQMPPRVPADLRQRALLITTHSGELALSFTGDDDGSVRDQWLAGCRTLLSYFSASLPRLLSKTRSPQTLLQGMVPSISAAILITLLNYGWTEICLRSAILIPTDDTYDAEQVDAASLQRAHREGPAALTAAQGVVQVIEAPCSPLARDCRCCGPPRRLNTTACCADGWPCVVQAREQAKRQALGLPATATEAQVPLRVIRIPTAILT